MTVPSAADTPAAGGPAAGSSGEERHPSGIPADVLGAARAALRERQGQGARYDADAAPAADLALARLGTAYFARKLNELPDAALSQPSARPGWSRRRVIADVALQGRAIAQSLEIATARPTHEHAATGPEALDLAETLPAQALRNLVAHAAVHLNVVWRDLTDAEWDVTVPGLEGAGTARRTAALRARAVWRGALDLGNGARPGDLPPEFRDDAGMQH